ncbi:hypothetical protein AABM34_23710 [Lysinibacillus fusiformis]
MSYLNIYFSMMIIPAAVLLLGHSAKFKAAWIYKILPLKDYTNLQKGSLKAFLIKLYVPLFLVLSLVFSYIYGIRIIPDLLVVLVTSWIYTLFCFVTMSNKIPFTKPYDEVGDAQGWKTFLLFIPIAILAGLHYLIASQIAFGPTIYFIVLFFINMLVWKLAFK